MDQVLAQLYGTNGVGLEKTAADQFLDALRAEGINPEELEEAQLTELAEAYTASAAGVEEDDDQAGVDSGSDGDAMGDPAPDASMAKEAEAEFRIADFMGRTMAHAFVDEFQKTAGTKIAEFPAFLAGKKTGETGKTEKTEKTEKTKKTEKTNKTKTASAAVREAVEARAIELLAANGYLD